MRQGRCLAQVLVICFFTFVNIIMDLAGSQNIDFDYFEYHKGRVELPKRMNFENSFVLIAKHFLSDNKKSVHSSL